MPRKLAEREKRVARKMKAKQTVNSGVNFQDGDARRVFAEEIGGYGYRGLMIENKSTDKKQFTLKRDVLDKAEIQAMPNRDLPVVVIDFGDKQFAVVGMDEFTDLVDFALEQKQKTEMLYNDMHNVYGIDK